MDPSSSDVQHATKRLAQFLAPPYEPDRALIVGGFRVDQVPQWATAHGHLRFRGSWVARQQTVMNYRCGSKAATLAMSSSVRHLHQS